MLPKKKSGKNILNIKQSQISQNSYNRDPSQRKLSFFDKPPGINQKVNNNSIELNKKTSYINVSKINVKELEALEKKAVKLFYEKKFEETFAVLQQCLDFIEKLDSLEHKIYIHYIYTEVFFKLKQYNQCLQHYDYTKNLYKASSTNQQKNLNGYMMNLECLHLSILFEMENYETVIQLVDDLLENLEKGTAGWLQCQSNKMKALMQIRDYEQAIKSGLQLIKYLSKENDKIKYILKLSMCLENCQRFEQAIEIIEKYLMNCNENNKDEKYNALYRRIAQLSLNFDDEIKTIFCLEKIKKNNINDQQLVETCRMLAKLYNQIGDFQKCCENCENFIDADTDAEYLILYADSIFRLGNKEEAINIYTKFLNQDKNILQKSRVFINLMQLVDPDELESVEEKFIQQTQKFRVSESIVGITEYANVLRKNQDFSKAQSFYKHAANQAYLSKLPQYLFAVYFNLGEMLQELQRKSESLMYYSKALKLNVQHEYLDELKQRIRGLKSQI